MDWFPRMRAMSLVSNEGDSEQNEIRNLQERLESTMSLVKQLSSQLAELKEQVGALPRPQPEHVQWAHSLPSGHGQDSVTKETFV